MTNNMKHTAIKNSTWWILLIYLVITFVLPNVLASPCIGSYSPNSTQSQLPKVARVPNNICYTPACIHAASQLLDDMDSSIDPCDDFYKFACGNFIQRTTIPDDQVYVQWNTVFRDKIRGQLRKVMEEPIRTDERKPTKLVKDFYKSCMDKNAIEEQGFKPLLKILQKVGGWPVLEGDNWNENDFDWIQTVSKLREIGFSTNYFFDLRIAPDIENNTRKVLILNRPKFLLPDELSIEGKDETILNVYADYMIDIAVILGASRENATTEFFKSLAFQKALVNIPLLDEKRPNDTLPYDIRSIQQLSTDYPSIRWKEYFNKWLGPKAEIYDNETIIFVFSSYISDFEKLLNKTPKRTQANYAMWQVVLKSVRFLNENIRKKQLEYNTKRYGISERDARWKECVNTVANSLSLSVGSLYVEKYFNEDAKKNVIDMVKNIRDQFHEVLKQANWMDENTRKSALDKAASMTTHIAYPDELLDDNKLEEFYSDLELSGDNYLQNFLNVKLFIMNYECSEFRKPVNKSDWRSRSSPTVANAFHKYLENSIIIPAAILQGKSFDSKRPKYMNYGGIGFVIGHEITHGFDSKRVDFDKDGNLVDWWEETTYEKYLEKVQCLIYQYSNYTDAEVGLNLNGTSTQDENIADNGGIKVSYLAYEKWVSKNGEEQTLPGLHYNPKQLFWISAANMHCAKYRPKFHRALINYAEHSLNKFRILGSFSNIIDFAKDFNCPVGSKMNPKSKCVVW